MSANPVELIGGLTTSSNVAKADMVAWAKARVPQVLADATEVRNTTLAGQLVVFVQAERRNYILDTSDTTSPDDGLLCIISSDGKRFKADDPPSDVVSVMDFGALGDGVTDDSDAINAAITFCNARSSTSYPGGTVTLPQTGNSYYITKSITLLKGVSLLGAYGKSSTIVASDCDAISLDFVVGFGQQTIKGLGFAGVNATAPRNAIVCPGDTSNEDVICGLQIENNLFQNFDTAIRLRSVEDCIIRDCWGLNLNQGVICTGVVYNSTIDSCNFQYVTGGGTGGTSFAGVSLGNFTYTTGGTLPPEGIRINNCQIFGFQIGIDAEACDTLNINNNDVVATVYGIKFNTVTTVNTIMNNNVEMQSSTALIGIYGVAQSAATNNLHTVIFGNTVQGELATTACWGIQVNSAGLQYQNGVVIQDNFCKNLNGYDIACYNPGGNTKVLNNKCLSSAATGSILSGTPWDNSVLEIRGNLCAKTIDQTVIPTNLTSGVVRDSDNVINYLGSAALEPSSWYLQTGNAPYINFTGPATTRRTYTLPDANMTVARTDAAQTFTGTQTFSSTIAGSINGNAATVTTNANLTGDVTSTGNAATLTNAAAISKVLTGFTAGAGTVAATDSILAAFQKVVGNLAPMLSAWTPFTPTITSAGGTVTGATIVATGRYQQIGKTVIVEIDITLTSIGTGSPTGAVRATVPITARASSYVGTAVEVAVTGKSGAALVAAANPTFVSCSDSTNTTFWVNGYRPVITITYEVP